MSEPLDTTEGTVVATDAATATATPTTLGGGKNVVMPSKAIGRLKQEARERGKKEAMSELETQAKAAGFGSVADMFAAVAAINKPKTPVAVATTKSAKLSEEEEPEEKPAQRSKQSYKEQSRYEAKLERERAGREAERRQRIAEQRRSKEISREKEALEAEMALRETALMAGVTDVDYAVSLLRRDISNKDEKELAGFDEKKYFEELRGTRPYLFGEIVRPANTGTGAKTPASPKPGQALSNAAADAQVDTTKMNDKDFREHLRKRGLSLDVAGV